MRIAIAALIAVTLAGTGCVVVRPPRAARSGVSSGAKRCPPGHVWSDGACHAKGKGHDR